MTRRTIFVTLLWLLTGGAHSVSGPPGQPATASADLGRGPLLFEAHCAACHGAQGHGDGPIAETLARDFQVRPTDLGLPALQKSRDDNQMAMVIRGGGQAVHQTPYMPPADKTLTDKEVGALVAFIREIKPPAVDTVADDTVSSFSAITSNLVLGRFLYSTRCLACHGDEGRGDGPFLTDLESASVTVRRPPDFEDYAFVRNRSDRDLEITINKGLDHSGWRPEEETRWLERPLDDIEMRALVFHLRAFSLGQRK